MMLKIKQNCSESVWGDRSEWGRKKIKIQDDYYNDDEDR